jgi:hypothetical protein
MSNDKIKNKVNLKKNIKEKKIESTWVNLANSLHVKWDSDTKKVDLKKGQKKILKLNQ